MVTDSVQQKIIIFGMHFWKSICICELICIMHVLAYSLYHLHHLRTIQWMTESKKELKIKFVCNIRYICGIIKINYGYLPPAFRSNFIQSFQFRFNFVFGIINGADNVLRLFVKLICCLLIFVSHLFVISGCNCMTNSNI